MSFQMWVRQPTTIAGLAALVGSIGGAVAHFWAGEPVSGATVGGLVASAVLLFVNDNTVAKNAGTLVTDAVDAAVSRHFNDRMPTLINDAVVLEQAVARRAVDAPVARMFGACLLMASGFGLAACGDNVAAVRAATDVMACLEATRGPVSDEIASADSDLRKGVAIAADLAAAGTIPACAAAVADIERANAPVLPTAAAH
jgi:hypothetical protein